MSSLARLHQTTQGRRGSRIDLEEGGAIWVSPEIAQAERSRVSRKPGAVQGAPGIASSGVMMTMVLQWARPDALTTRTSALPWRNLLCRGTHRVRNPFSVRICRDAHVGSTAIARRHRAPAASEPAARDSGDRRARRRLMTRQRPLRGGSGRSADSTSSANS